MPETLELIWDDVMVGYIKKAYISDGTGYGLFELTICPKGPRERRLVDFITFCDEWHARLEAYPSNPPNVTEFDKFSDLVNSKLWMIKSPDGTSCQLLAAPVFVQGEVTWDAQDCAGCQN